MKKKTFNISPGDLARLSGTKVVATSTTGLLEEYLQAHANLTSSIQGRLVFRES